MTTFGPNDYVIEPANIQTLKCVRTVNVANAPRMEVLPPENGASGDYGVSNTFVDNYVITNATGMVGDITLEEGYNCSIVTKGNTIQVSALSGTGKSIYGKTPAEIAVTEEEQSLLSAGKYLSRGPSCRDLVGSINGIHGPSVSFTVGDGLIMEAGEGFINIHLTETAKSKECEMPECNPAINSQKGK